MDSQFTWIIDRRSMGKLEQLCALGSGQQRQSRYAQVRRSYNRAQQPAEMVAHALDGRGIEQICVVLKDASQSAGSLLERQRQIKFCYLQVGGDFCYLETGELERFVPRILQHEHFLE